MKRFFTASFFCSCVVALMLSACNYNSTEHLITANSDSDAGSLAKISDGAHEGGNAHFYFLPPMVPAPEVSGNFDNTLSPEVSVCALSGEVCDFILVCFSSDPASGSETVRVVGDEECYIVNWHTDQFSLSSEITYRITVSVANQVLGYADVDVVNSGKELKNMDTGEYIALKAGRTLPIKFRIEEGALSIPGLIAYWDFNEGSGSTLADKSGNGNNGTLLGNPEWVSGVEGSALRFDGDGDYVKIPDNGTLDFAGTGKVLTISAWIKSDVGEFKRLITKCDYSNNKRQWRFDVRDNIKLGFAMYSNPADWHFARGERTTTDPITLDQWMHVAVTADITNENINFYVNGIHQPDELVSKDLFSGGMVDTDTPVLIGADGGSSPDPDLYFNGAIDEISVYDRILSEPELMTLYQNHTVE